MKIDAQRQHKMSADMTDDLVKRLRIWHETMSEGSTPIPELQEAADAIDRLTAERDAAWGMGAARMQKAAIEKLKGYNEEDNRFRRGFDRACGLIRAISIRALSPSTLNKPE